MVPGGRGQWVAVLVLVLVLVLLGAGGVVAWRTHRAILRHVCP